MRLSRLKWVFLGTALVFLGIMEVSRRLIQPYLASWGGHLLMSGVVLTCILFYFGATFELVSRMQDRLERQNRELLALHEASSDIYGEVALESVLQKVVDQARQLGEARYGALAVVDHEGRIDQFLVSGIEPEVVAGIGHPPRGKGLLGIVLNEGQRLRIADMSRDPRSVGFPRRPSADGLPARRAGVVQGAVPRQPLPRRQGDGSGVLQGGRGHPGAFRRRRRHRHRQRLSLPAHAGVRGDRGTAAHRPRDARRHGAGGGLRQHQGAGGAGVPRKGQAGRGGQAARGAGPRFARRLQRDPRGHPRPALRRRAGA